MSAATVFEDAQSGDEQSLDAAFEAVDIASRFYSTSVARAVGERWLWGAGWKRVAHMLGVRAVRRVLRVDGPQHRVLEWDGALRRRRENQRRENRNGKIALTKSVPGKSLSENQLVGKSSWQNHFAGKSFRQIYLGTNKSRGGAWRLEKSSCGKIVPWENQRGGLPASPFQ